MTIKIAPTFTPAESFDAGMKQHLSTRELELLPLTKGALQFPAHDVLSAYAVYDAYQRRLGVVFRARYETEKAATWFAASNSGHVSTHLLTKRDEALKVLEVFWAAELMGLGGSLRVTKQ